MAEVNQAAQFRAGLKSSSTRWLIALLVLIFLFHASTIRRGHRWGDDYALYIHHAKNIATGTPYANIGYIFDPYYPQYSVRVAAPVFPLFLAPVYKTFGMNFTAFKMVEVVFFVAALAACFALFRPYLSLPYALLLVAIMGFSPFFWDFKDDVLSDIPFFFFVFLTALLMEKRKPPVLCGIAAYLAIGTRTVGIVLLPAILVYELYCARRLTKHTVITLLTTTVFLLLQPILLHGDPAASYSNLLHPTLHGIVTNVGHYLQVLGYFWHTPAHWLTVLISVAMLLTAIRGFSRQQPAFLAVFACFYGVTLIIWPVSQELRFLIPLLPLFLFYAVQGMQRLGKVATVMVCALLLVGYGLRYRTENFSVIPESIGRDDFVAMCTHVQANTQPTDRMVFNRARTLSLFTDRPASPYHQPANPDDLWKYFKDQNIRYVIVSSLFEKDRNVLEPVIRLHQAELDLKYQNLEFQVYRVRD